MPCNDGSRHDDQAEIGRLMEMLCAQCKASEAAGVLIAPEVDMWWRGHKRRDQQRQEDEARWARQKEAEEREQLATLQAKYGNKTAG